MPTYWIRLLCYAPPCLLLGSEALAHVRTTSGPIRCQQESAQTCEHIVTVVQSSDISIIGLRVTAHISSCPHRASTKKSAASACSRTDAVSCVARAWRLSLAMNGSRPA